MKKPRHDSLAESPRATVGMLDTLFDDNGALPCAAPDSCPACCLFTEKRPDETNVELGRRLMRALLEAEAEAEWQKLSG